MSSNGKAKPMRRTSTAMGESEALDASYQKWINQQMEKRASEYSDITNITICCGTWNVNTRLLSDSCDMKQWLLHQLHQAADIYAITLQEIVDLNVMNVVVNSKGSDEMALYWQKQIFATILESGQEYRQVFEKHMVGLQVLLFVKAVHLPHIHDIRSIVTYTGGYGVTGNKGGISVRFDFHDSPLCFIGAHFHANRENVMTRNMDWQTILEASVFPPNGRSLTDPTDIRPYSASYKAIKTSLTLSLANHDIFWAGDLNYRITSDIEDEDIFAVVKADNWVSLRGMDQLNQEREKGNVFAAFQEGTIHFPPTYKYQPGTDVYEQRPEKKLRAPAWCDRILWRTAGHKDDIRLVSYDAIRLNISDHKPVVAWFECGMKQFVQDKVRNVYQELLFAVDKWVNASTPKLAVDNRIIDFGDVLLNQKYNNTVTLRNIGTVMAEWTFVPKNDELCVSKPWLKFEPEEGILAPGETTTIKVVLNVTAELAVNGMTEKELKNALEDIVILRLAKGSDFFIVVSGRVDMAHVEEARKSMRKITVDNPIANKAAAKKEENRHGSMRLPKPAAAGTRTSTPRATRSSESDDDTEDAQEIAMDDIYK